MSTVSAWKAVFLAAFLLPRGAAASGVKAYAFRGTIGPGLAVEMELDRQDNQLHGSYVYVKIGKPLFLDGSIGDDGAVHLEESQHEDGTTASFVGTLAADGKLTGTWTATRSVRPHAPPGKSLPFSLTPVPRPAPDPRLARWIGHWTRINTDITIVELADGRLRAWGWATGPYTMPDGEPSADTGSFQALAAPRGDAVTFVADGCTVVARLVEEDLVVDSDLGCAGNRASFVGSFGKAP